MTHAAALVLLRHHKAIIAEIGRLPTPEPDAEKVLQPYRESVAKLEKHLGKTKGT